MASSPTSSSLTERLRRYSGDDRELAESVLREVLPKLHQTARSALSRERRDAQAISPTELINEVWLRSLHKGRWLVSSRNHFYAIAAIAMRRVLIDLARSRMAEARGSGARTIALDDSRGGTPADRTLDPRASPETLVILGELMDALEKADIEAARIVDMHYFAGFTIAEIAEITGWSERQVRGRWKKGENWLKDRL